MLTAPARRAIINSMSALSVPAGTEIITQGDADATRFFVLASGRATVHVADAKTGMRKQVATLKPARFALASACSLRMQIRACHCAPDLLSGHSRPILDMPDRRSALVTS